MNQDPHLDQPSSPIGLPTSPARSGARVGLGGCGWMLLGSFLTVAAQVIGCVTLAKKTADVLTAPMVEQPSSAPLGYKSWDDAREDKKRMDREREEALRQQSQ